MHSELSCVSNFRHFGPFLPFPLPPCSGTVYGVIYEQDNAKNRSEPLRGMTAHALLLYQNRLVVSRSDFKKCCVLSSTKLLLKGWVTTKTTITF